MIKKLAGFVLKAGVTGGLFYLLFKNLGFGSVFQSVLSASLPHLGVATLLFFISLLSGAWQWQALLAAQGVALPFKKIFSLYMVGHFFNNFLPGAFGGDVVKIYRLKKNQQRGFEGAAATLVDRFAGLFVLCVLALLSSIYVRYVTHIRLENDLLLYTGISCAVFIAGIFVLFNERVAALLYEVALKRVNPLGLKDKVQDAHGYLHLYGRTRGIYAKVLLISLFTQVLRIAVHYFAGLAVGFRVPFIYYVIFVPLISLPASLPVSLGGLGVREGLGKVLFGHVHPNGALAVATEFLASLVGILTSIVGGVIFLLEKAGKEKES